MELTDRVVIVTGAGSGIGEAIARAAHAAGARHVVVADLHGDEAERVAADIGGTAVAIDVFVSNAGFVTAAGLEDTNEAIQTMWEVHCMAHIYAARAVLPSMIARGEGYILSTASAAGLLTQIGSMAYSMTKVFDRTAIHSHVDVAEWRGGGRGSSVGLRYSVSVVEVGLCGGPIRLGGPKFRRRCGAVDVFAVCDYRVGRASTYVPIERRSTATSRWIFPSTLIMLIPGTVPCERTSKGDDRPTPRCSFRTRRCAVGGMYRSE